jgi:hypothetical protein
MPGSLLATVVQGPQPRYGVRVGKLEIRSANQWGSTKNFELHESTSANPDLPEAVQLIVDNLEAAIKSGLALLQRFAFYIDKGEEMYLLYSRINALWNLCICMGTVLCEPGINLGGKYKEDLTRGSSWTAETLEGILVRTRALSLVEGTFADHLPLPGSSKKERAAFNKFTVETNKQHGSLMDRWARNFAFYNFRLQVKEIED